MCRLATDDYLCGCLAVVDIVSCDSPTCAYRNLHTGMLVEECANRTGGCSRPGGIPADTSVEESEDRVGGGRRPGEAPEDRAGSPVVEAVIAEMRRGTGRKRTGRDVVAKAARDAEGDGRKGGGEGGRGERGEGGKVRTWWGFEM